MTARNLQAKAKEKGHPWTTAKGYDTFCPIAGTVIPKESIPDPHNVELWLKVDGIIKQKGSSNQMIFKHVKRFIDIWLKSITYTLLEFLL